MVHPGLAISSPLTLLLDKIPGQNDEQVPRKIRQCTHALTPYTDRIQSLV